MNRPKKRMLRMGCGESLGSFETRAMRFGVIYGASRIRAVGSGDARYRRQSR